MKSNQRLLKIAMTLLTIGAAGQLVMHSSMAQRNHMSMMGGMMMGGMMEKRMPQGISPDQLPKAGSDGAKLVGRYCSQCHGIPGPGLHTASEWPAVVSRMNRRMQKMSRKRMMMQIEAPTSNELNMLIAYLEKNAQRTIELNKLGGADTSAGRAFQKTCSQCHALPDPAQHTSNEWPAVIKRMRKNMTSMGKSLPDQTTMDQILGFLQMHSAK
ncbi:hypothetical protein MNBD_GAMMA24-852 [hydrothermal vent metagenome]|uniref:Uncharacterized protein n=1 Tax=hydrothermal vent metagenome TaxID=652676 RepID=A0A3B1BRJ7_9ZZZZ